MVQEEQRLSVWESLSNRISLTPPHNNLLILGDFIAQLHTRKEGEEDYLGPHIFGKGAAFLQTKEGLQADK
eukprot:3778235-Heterocapsa_arctica.AAC.1